MNRLTTRNQVNVDDSENMDNNGSDFSERYNVDGRHSNYKNQSGNSSHAQNMYEE